MWWKISCAPALRCIRLVALWQWALSASILVKYNQTFECLTLSTISTQSRVSVAHFTHTPHYLHRGGSPILRICLYTQNQAALAIRCTSVSFHTAHWSCRSKRGIVVQIMMLWSVCVFLKVFPRCLPVNLNMYPRTVYNHMDVLWLRSWPTKHPRKWQIYVFHSKLHNYIITISKQDLV